MSTIEMYTVELEPPLSAIFWQPQYPADTPRWHHNVFSCSAEAA